MADVHLFITGGLGTGSNLPGSIPHLVLDGLSPVVSQPAAGGGLVAMRWRPEPWPERIVGVAEGYGPPPTGDAEGRVIDDELVLELLLLGEDQ